METKTKKIEWSKPVLEEFAKVRYTLGGKPCDVGTGGAIPQNCRPGGEANNHCSSGTGASKPQ